MVGATIVGTGGDVCILAFAEALKVHFVGSWKANIKEIE